MAKNLVLLPGDEGELKDAVVDLTIEDDDTASSSDNEELQPKPADIREVIRHRQVVQTLSKIINHKMLKGDY